MKRLPTMIANALIGLVVLATLVLIVVVIRRELSQAGVPLVVATKRVTDAEWRRAVSGGRAIGLNDAPVTVVVFSNFECKACRKFSSASMGPIRNKYPREVRFLFRHLPLERHRFSLPAAIAAECAARQNRFEQFHDALFESADTLESVAYAGVAAKSKVPDLDRFAICLASPGSMPEIDRDVAAANSLGPLTQLTVYVNGWRINALPDSARLDSVVTATTNPTRVP
jgi:protein-disulfide isomerase